MKKVKNKDFINDILLSDKLLKKVIIPFNVLLIIAGCGYSIDNSFKNSEIYFSISSDAPSYGEGTIKLNGYNKISGKTVANKIENADKKNGKENVYAFRVKKDNLSMYEPVYVSTSGKPTYVQMVNQDDFTGFGYGKVMYDRCWYDESQFSKEKTYVDPISTEELESNYNFYLEKEGIFEDITNSFSSTSVYVMQKKD